MIFPKAKKIAKAQDWYQTKTAVFGIYKGYLFNIGDGSIWSNPPYKYVSCTLENLTEAQKINLKTELENNRKILKYANFQINENRLYIQFLENLTFTKIKTVYFLLDFITDRFKIYQIPEQNACQNCDEKHEINYYNLNENGTILCDPCFSTIRAQFNELENQKNKLEKNYLIGFLGSLLFAIPGIIIWVLIAVYLERLASVMAIIIALLGLKGYQFLNGKQGRWTNFLILISNIVCIVIANFFTVYLMLVKEGSTFNDSLQQFQRNHLVRTLFFTNTMILFFLATFVWIWLLFILKNKKLSIEIASKPA